jgi:hypothetical protein
VKIRVRFNLPIFDVTPPCPWKVCDAQVRATCIALFLFLMNNVGGNLPVIVDPISKAIGYREALYLIWPGSIVVSGVLFFVASLPLLCAARRSHSD